MKIHVWSRGETAFTLDGEFAGPTIREAIEDGCNDAASVITDYTDTERSDISYDDYAVVTSDFGTELWRGWLTGDKDAPAPDAAPEVQVSPCPVETHEGEHVQVRTHGHWMCGHLLADLLGANGIPPSLAADRDRLAGELTEANAKWGRSLDALSLTVAERDKLTDEMEAVHTALGWEDHQRAGWRFRLQLPMPEELSRVTLIGVRCDPAADIRDLAAERGRSGAENTYLRRERDNALSELAGARREGAIALDYARERDAARKAAVRLGDLLRQSLDETPFDLRPEIDVDAILKDAGIGDS